MNIIKKIAGIVIIIESLVAIFGCFAWLQDTYSIWKEYGIRSRIWDMIGISMLLIPVSAGIYYVVTTSFGSKPTVLENLEKENQIIKKQIEKRELLAKLETLEKK